MALQGHADEAIDAAERIHTLETSCEATAGELERAKRRLAELEGARSSISAREATLRRQKAALEASVDEQGQGERLEVKSAICNDARYFCFQKLYCSDRWLLR